MCIRDRLLTSGLEDNLGAAFVFSPCFVIELLDVSAFTLGFDVNFFETFALTVDFVWVFDFGLTLDFTAMTHILSLIIETPSASFLNDQFVPHKTSLIHADNYPADSLSLIAC